MTGDLIWVNFQSASRLLAYVAWRFWLGAQSNKAGRGQRNRDPADDKRGGRLVIAYLFSRCLYLLVEVFTKVSIQSVLVIKIYMCLAALFVVCYTAVFSVVTQR